MCLIFFAINQHAKYKLILAGNRDEFYGRKTAEANFWDNHPTILGGCDLEVAQPDGTCGTWMGITKTGRISFITNFRDPKNINPKAPSRGHLVTDYLIDTVDPEVYMRTIQSKASQYNGFNLVTGDPNRLFYFSNYQNEIKKLEKGFFGLSNHLLDTPWPKVSLGKTTVGQELSKPDISINNLFEILRNESQAPDSQLPDTGIGLERERALSSLFIKTNGYGTRCSTVILINQANEVTFQERTYNLTDFTFETKIFKFTIQTDA